MDITRYELKPAIPIIRIRIELSIDDAKALLAFLQDIEHVCNEDRVFCEFQSELDAVLNG